MGSADAWQRLMWLPRGVDLEAGGVAFEAGGVAWPRPEAESGIFCVSLDD